MKRHARILLGLCSASLASAVQAQVVFDFDPSARSEAQRSTQAASITAYWTPERMRSAKAMPTPTRVVSASELTATFETDRELMAAGAGPGYANGCPPNDGDCASVERTLPPGTSLYEASLAAPQHGAKPANPQTGPYGPFQRWTEHDPINKAPKSTIGKLFFTIPGQGNFVCSGSVINRNTVITAGHCNSSGAGVFATNRLFCPAWKNGENAAFGCWTVTGSSISTAWHTSGDPDYDYSCLIMATTGTKQAKPIGNVTGWLGRAWNFSAAQAERTFGYPQAAPFNGNRLVTTASTDWYEHDFRAGGQVSKIIGSDMTGGSSGGPWILGWAGQEFADSDASITTDPGSNWVNGVNSHKRCVGNCNSPPTTTAGVFWQEMTSPPFRNTSEVGESEDVIAGCFANGGA